MIQIPNKIKFKIQDTALNSLREPMDRLRPGQGADAEADTGALSRLRVASCGSRSFLRSAALLVEMIVFGQEKHRVPACRNRKAAGLISKSLGMVGPISSINNAAKAMVCHWTVKRWGSHSARLLRRERLTWQIIQQYHVPSS